MVVVRQGLNPLKELAGDGVRGTAIYGGTMQIHRNMIAAQILDRRNDQRRR